MGVGLFLLGAIVLAGVAFTQGGWWLLGLPLAFGLLWLAVEVFDAVYDKPDDR